MLLIYAIWVLSGFVLSMHMYVCMIMYVFVCLSIYVCTYHPLTFLFSLVYFARITSQISVGSGLF